MKKLINISGAASPHMVNFIAHLRRYFDAEFYFYEMPLTGRRADWWRMDLGDHGHIVKCCFSWNHKLRFSPELYLEVKKFNPDIVMLGGFAELSNYLVYRWAKKHGKRTVIFTEAARDNVKGSLKAYTFIWKVIRFLYRHVDCVMAVQKPAYRQFKEVFKFGDKVIYGNYPADIDSYFNHPIRKMQTGCRIIFPNRLTDQYNPFFAMEVFSRVLQLRPSTRMVLNAVGELRDSVDQLIEQLGLKNKATFLDNIKSWKDLDDVYSKCDIMLLPAKYSTGNYTLTEGMASGMACIVSENVHTLSANQLIENSTGKVLPLVVSQWVDAILWYIDHPEEFAKFTPINRDLKRCISLEGTAQMFSKILK